MRKLIFASVIISLIFSLSIIPGCQQKPKEAAKPAEVTEPAKEMEGMAEEGKAMEEKAEEAGKEMKETGK